LLGAPAFAPPLGPIERASSATVVPFDTDLTDPSGSVTETSNRPPNKKTRVPSRFESVSVW
jgi:hypothetical protein